MLAKTGGVHLNEILTGDQSDRGKFNALMRANLTRRQGNPSKEARYKRTRSYIDMLCQDSCIDDFLEVEDSRLALKRDEPLFIVLNSSLVDKNHDILIYEVSSIDRIGGGLLAHVGNSPLRFFKTYTKRNPGYFEYDFKKEFEKNGLHIDDFTIPIPEYIFPGFNDGMEFLHAVPRSRIEDEMERLQKFQNIKAEKKRFIYESERELKEKEPQKYEEIREKLKQERLDLAVVREIKHDMFRYFMRNVVDISPDSTDNALNKLDLDSDDISYPANDPWLRLMFRDKSIHSYYEREKRRGNGINDYNGFRAITKTKEQYYQLALFPVHKGWVSITGSTSPYDAFPRMSGHQSLNTRWIEDTDKKVEIQYFDHQSFMISTKGPGMYYYVIEENGPGV